MNVRLPSISFGQAHDGQPTAQELEIPRSLLASVYTLHHHNINKMRSVTFVRQPLPIDLGPVFDYKNHVSLFVDCAAHLGFQDCVVMLYKLLGQLSDIPNLN